MGIFLYHGTSKKSANNIKKHGVDLSYSRKNLDFGVGFYLTSNKGQAKNWAYRNGHNNAVVIIFEADFIGLNQKKFDGFDAEWGNVVYENRVNETDILQDYDVVVGKMADGRMGDLVDDAKDGIISKEEFIAEISNDIGTQIVFKTNRALTQLKYIDKEVLK